MTTELLEKEEVTNRIPIEERMAVQGLIMEIIMKENNLSDVQMDLWALDKEKGGEGHGKELSDIIDDPKNVNLRSLIMTHNYQLAAEEIIKLLK